jgi:hypothetical protein
MFTPGEIHLLLVFARRRIWLACSVSTGRGQAWSGLKSWRAIEGYCECQCESESQRESECSNCESDIESKSGVEVVVHNVNLNVIANVKVDVQSELLLNEWSLFLNQGTWFLSERGL